MRGFQQRIGALEGLGARVAGVSADTWAANAAFQESNGIGFPLLSDWPDRKTATAFGVAREESPTTMRVTFVFDADGVVRRVIDDARDMDAHPIGALEALQEIASG